jgi:hypothetical protein
MTDEVCRLVFWHMYDLDGRTRESKVRRAILENADILDKLLALKQADFSACKDNLGVAPVVARWQKVYAQMLADRVPLGVKDLAVHGDELIAMGIAPEKVGKILKVLLVECATQNLLNTRPTLKLRAAQLDKGIDIPHKKV